MIELNHYLLDTHYHFDFIEGDERRSDFLKKIHQSGWDIVAQTVLPSKYLQLHQSNIKPKHISLGFHPWYIQSIEQAEEELAVFQEALSTTRFIGEIGMDFSENGLKYANETLQEVTFKEILKIICHAPSQNNRPYILSVHAVHCINEVLDIFEALKLGDHHIIPIIHRFNGTSDELTRLMRGGGYISVHPEMFTKKKGRAYIQQIPKDRILLETDLPQNKGSLSSHIQEFNQSMTTEIETVSQLREENMIPVIQATQHKLYGVS